MKFKLTFTYKLFCLWALFGFSAAAQANPTLLSWEPCYQKTGFNYECASLPVPLDHQRSNWKRNNRGGDTIDIAMVRLPATDQANRKGSLFLNPGGPGGSGIELLLNVGPFFLTDDIRARFDLIGFDPRGVGQSNPLLCFESEEELQPLNDLPVFPITHEEEQAHIEGARQMINYCKTRNGDLLRNMTTADVARDLDLMREAVGDERLYYYGLSYGSFLGTTYANLFPEKVGGLVVDAALDPVAWATGQHGEKHYLPVIPRIGSDKGAGDTLDEFFRLCNLAEFESCPLTGDARARFFNLIEKIKVTPLPVETEDGTALMTHDFLTNMVLESLYNSDGWVNLSWFLYLLESGAPAPDTGTQYQLLLSSLGRESDEEDGKADRIEGVGEAFAAVMCTDSDNPQDAFFWSQTADIAESENGIFGRAWTWKSIYCETLGPSRKSRYAGPFNRDTVNPVLVINSYFDPATYYQGAVILDRILANSFLLPVVGWGHGSAFASSCSAEIASNYLLNGQLPEEGTVCMQDFPPFNLQWDVAGKNLTPPADAGDLSKWRRISSRHGRAEDRKHRSKLMKSLIRNHKLHRR